VKRLVYFSLLYAGSATVLRALGFVLSLWMARTLTQESYGAWGLIYASQTGIATFGLVGIQEAVVGLLKHQRGEHKRRRLYAAANAAFLRTVGVTLLVAAVYSGFFLVPKSSGAAGVIGVLISGALLAFATLQAQIIRLEEDHLGSLSFSFGVPLAGLLGSFGVFAIYRSIEGFFVGSAIAMIIAVLVLQGRSKVRLIGRLVEVPDRVLRMQVLSRLTPFIAVAFFGWLSGYGNTFFVDQIFDSAEVARLTFVLTIGSMIQLVSSALNQVWSPRFFSLMRSQPFDAVERRNQRFFNSLALVLGALTGLCVVGLPPLLRFVGGNLTAYTSMHIELFLVASGYIVLAPWSHCQNYFLAHDKGKLLLRVVIVTSVIGIGVWLALMWLLGPMGIYVGFFAQMLLRSVGIALAARGQWPVRIGWGGVAAGMLLAAIGLLIAMI